MPAQLLPSLSEDAKIYMTPARRPEVLLGPCYELMLCCLLSILPVSEAGGRHRTNYGDRQWYQLAGCSQRVAFKPQVATSVVING